MTRPAHLFDIGSTYTKVVAVDLDDPARFDSAAVPTTHDDIGGGVAAAGDAMARWGRPVLRAACSSAAGGLRVAVSGLVRRLTVDAANRAALGSGARITACLSSRLGPKDVERVDADAPHVVLLAGGIDGGDEDVVRHNAAALAALRCRPAVVVACNAAVSTDVGASLAGLGLDVRVVPNLMPDIDRLDLEPTRAAIREIFLARIAEGPGLAGVARGLDTSIVPTPRASMEAVRWFGQVLGAPVMAVEVGGATTNVYSHAAAEPATGVVVRGLPAEVLTRTVEGDLGVRHNADSVVAAAGERYFEVVRGLPMADVRRWVDRVRGTPRLPVTDQERAIDEAMALYCIGAALERHAGRQQRRRTLEGRDVVIQEGKDLRSCRLLLASGGSVRATTSEPAIAGTVADSDPEVLVPRDAGVVIDRHYVLYAIGLLARVAPDAAAGLARSALARMGVATAARS